MIDEETSLITQGPRHLGPWHMEKEPGTDMKHPGRQTSFGFAMSWK